MSSSLLSLVSIISVVVAIVVAEQCPLGYEPYDAATFASNQVVQWTPCPVDDQPSLECATINVLLDYTNSSYGTMTLPVVRIPADSAIAIGKSVFYNPGGPGASGIEPLLDFGDLLVNATGSIYHVVAFDPRGVGLTIPYQCPDVPNIADSSLPLNNPRGLNAAYFMGTVRGHACSLPEYKEAGELMGTAFVARDINALFEALHEDGLIRYWGSSYGTLLGTTLAAMFPEKIDRMVVDGNINPIDYYHGLGDESVDDADEALLHFFETCVGAGPEYCPLSKRGPSAQQLRDDFYDFMDDAINKNYVALPEELGTIMTYPEFSRAIFRSLGRPDIWMSAAVLIESAYNQSTSSPNLEKREFDVLETRNEPPDTALDAVTCGDWDDIPGDLTDFAEWLDIWQTRSRFGGDQYIQILFRCSTWQVNAREKCNSTFTNIKTKTPILFINNPYDHVTPMASALNASSGFVGSKVLAYTNGGHCTGADRSSCIREKMASYFVTGELPNVDEPCEPDISDVELFIQTVHILRNETITERDIQDNALELHAHNIIDMLRKPEPSVEYPAALRTLKPDVYHALLARRESATSTISGTTIPATCIPVATTGTLDSSPAIQTQTDDGKNAPSVEDQLNSKLDDLKDLCDGYSGDGWLFRLICGTIG